MKIRPIQPSDNAALAKIIRSTLESFGLGIPGTVYTDPSTDHLFELFREERSFYFVAEENGKVLGGCGIYPTKGLPADCAELVKLSLAKEARGKGVGQALMEKSMAWAREEGYGRVYLETMNELSSAVGLYQKLGFEKLSAPMGESGHHACQIWMLKKL